MFAALLLNMSESNMKSWYASKTLWFNCLTILGTGVSWILDYLTPYPMIVVGLVIAQAVINIVLRVVTKKAIK